jgi:Transposase DNA-binding
MRGADLGDARRGDRLEQIAEALARKPSESLPQAMGDEAALEAVYRFLGNEGVSPAAVLAPHVEKTVERCRAVGRALAVMDTSEVRYSGEREALGYLTNDKGRGVYAHVTLAVTPGTREPQGVLHCETWARQGPKKKRKNATKASDSEALRWQRSAQAVHDLLPTPFASPTERQTFFLSWLRCGHASRTSSSVLARIG